MIQNIKPFSGQHCETTATGTILNQLGLKFSEQILFGLGGRAGFHFLEYESEEKRRTKVDLHDFLL
jgi:hypothetical protein